jgi:hypothetical protein
MPPLTGLEILWGMVFYNDSAPTALDIGNGGCEPAYFGQAFAITPVTPIVSVVAASLSAVGAESL